MALAELCAWAIPSVLIPLPTAAANHQHHNAVALAGAGAGILLPESDLVTGALWEQITALAADDVRREDIAEHARRRGHPHAASEIVDALQRLLDE